MKFLKGDKLILNQKNDPDNQIYPLGTTAEVVEYAVGTMYKLKFNNGDVAECSEPFLMKYFIKKPKKGS